MASGSKDRDAARFEPRRDGNGQNDRVSNHPEIIIVARHAEKPEPTAGSLGVDRLGRADPHSLTVVGWQRAGALAALMAHAPSVAQPELVRPERVFATKPTSHAKSRRELDTASPAADRLGLEVDASHGHGQVDELAAQILADRRPALVVWHHGEIPSLARALGVDPADVPAAWPDGRYDLLWVLTHQSTPAATGEGPAHYSLEIVPQRLLAGDVAEV